MAHRNESINVSIVYYYFNQLSEKLERDNIYHLFNSRQINCAWLDIKLVIRRF